MKITEIKPIQGIAVTVEGGEWSDYTRYGPDCWYVAMGMSDEPVHDSEELESLYQSYVNQQDEIKDWMMKNAEIDAIGDDKHLLCRITHLEEALENLISVACRCDGWESFPQGALDDAEGVLNDG